MARWPDLLASGPAAFAADPAVHAYLLWRSEPVVSLLRDLRDRTDPVTALYLIDGKDGWLGGSDLRVATAACDGVILCAYDMKPAEAAAMLQAARAVVGPAKYLGAAFRLFYPEMSDAAALARRTRAAVASGCDGLSFYNYGLVPEARLDWVRQAMAAAP